MYIGDISACVKSKWTSEN